MKAAKILQSALIYILFVSVAVAQDVCKDVPVVFKQETVFSNNKLSTSFKQMLCSAEWKTYQEVVDAGVDVTIPIYGIPIPMSANYSSDKREAWQKQFCTASEQKLDYKSQAYKTAYEVSPVTADAWVKCQELIAKQQSGKVLYCSVNETETSTLFEAKWRRVDGEIDQAAPRVQKWEVKNTKCQSPIKIGSKINTGGTAALCDGNLEKAPTFLLQTNRGSCLAAGQLAETASEISGELVLNAATTYRGNKLLLKGGTKIVTNGYNLAINSKRIEVEGGVQIVSFLPREIPIGRVGRSAGEVKIQAEKISGSALTIANFGEDGGMGAKGSTGQQGPTGMTGDQKHWQNLEGCKGGEDGRQGGQGGIGAQGQQGANGGNGGDVIVNVKSGLTDGVLSLIDVVSKRNDRNGAVIACNGSCGGLGGLGGLGGDGGPGGRGGEGAPGNAECGGTNAGPGGPTGQPGTQGTMGSRGADGLLKILSF